MFDKVSGLYVLSFLRKCCRPPGTTRYHEVPGESAKNVLLLLYVLQQASSFYQHVLFVSIFILLVGFFPSIFCLVCSFCQHSLFTSMLFLLACFLAGMLSLLACSFCQHVLNASMIFWQACFFCCQHALLRAYSVY